MARPQNFAIAPFGRDGRAVAWTQPVCLSYENSDTTGVHLAIPFLYYRVRAVVVHVLSATESGADTWDLQGWDLAGGAVNADMFTLPAQDIVANRISIIHSDEAKSGYYTTSDSSADGFTQSSSMQLVTKSKNFFSTIEDTDVPSENRAMIPYIDFPAPPTAIDMKIQLFVDPVGAF